MHVATAKVGINIYLTQGYKAKSGLVCFVIPFCIFFSYLFCIISYYPRPRFQASPFFSFESPLRCDEYGLLIRRNTNPFSLQHAPSLFYVPLLSFFHSFFLACNTRTWDGYGIWDVGGDIWIKIFLYVLISFFIVLIYEYCQIVFAAVYWWVSIL